MILILDNYDSFTYNLAHYLQMLGAQVCVKRNDEITLAEIITLNPAGIVLSPGPGTPDNSGICLPVIDALGHTLPILGVCLGHQAIGQVFGGKIIQTQQVVHGKTSLIYHNNQGLFAHLPNPHRATRYHSLVIDPKTLPNCLDITAWTQTPEGHMEHVMGIAHKELPISGVQFHPESILSESGYALLGNFLKNLS